MSTIRYTCIGTAVVALLLVLSCVYIVDETQQALEIRLGKVVGRLQQSGLHVKAPLISKVVYYDKRILGIRSASCEVIAADQKRFIVDFYAKYKIIDPETFYRTVKSESGLENKVGSIIESHIRENVGRVTLVDFINKSRSDVMLNVLRGVRRETKKFGIEVVDVRVRRADLPEENSAAIFKRMQTDREKEARELRAEGAELAQKVRADADLKKRVMLADAMGRAQAVRGEGDAEAARIYNDALKVDPDFFDFYRTLKAYGKVFADSEKSRIVLTPHNNFMDLMNNAGGEQK